MQAIKRIKAVTQLSLVADNGNEAGGAPGSAIEPEQAAVDRVFQHWVWMLGKNRKRCALGPTRRRIIERALQLYDEDTLLLAVEGNAASAWHAGDNDSGAVHQDIELILRDEKHVERFADMGQQLRERAERAMARQLARQQASAAAAPNEQQATEAAQDVQRRKEYLRTLAASLRSA